MSFLDGICIFLFGFSWGMVAGIIIRRGLRDGIWSLKP